MKYSLLLLVACATVVAAPPKFTPPAELKPVAGYAVLDVEDPTVASVTYVALDPGADHLPGPLLRDPRDFLLPIRGLPAGRYRFAAVASSKTGEQVRADFAVVIDGPAPDPNPNPGPQPDPPKPDPIPNPKGVVAWVLVVEETDQRTADVASVLGDLSYWNGLKAKGIKWRFYDQDSPESTNAGYTTLAKRAGIPALLLLDKDGAVLSVASLPPTTAGVDAVIAAAKPSQVAPPLRYGPNLLQPYCPDGNCPLPR